MTDSVQREAASEQPNLLVSVLREFATRWKALVLLPFATAVLFVAVSFIVPKQYEGVAIFAPAEDASSAIPGNLASIAAQFGISAGSQGYSVFYFAQIAQSREVLRIVALDSLSDGSERRSVLDIVEVQGDSLDERTDKAIRSLRSMITLRVDERATIVTLQALGPSPALAAGLAGSVLRALDEVAIASIRRSGTAERRFAEAQVDSALQALRSAENQLRDFYTSNRSFGASPALQFDEARLRRQLQIRQDLYVSMVTQAEAAKLREVRNTPSISVVQPPQASPRKVWPSRATFALFGLIAGLAGVVAWIYLLRPLLRVARVDLPFVRPTNRSSA